MKNFLNSLVSLGPSGLFVAALLDGAGLPIPGGVDALVVFLSAQIPAAAVWLALVATIGSTIGNFFLFTLARRGGQAFLEKRASGRHSARFRRWFDRYGVLTVFVSALVPLPVMPMKIFVFSSGALGAGPIRFLIAFVGARIPRYLGLALLGRAMGNDALAYLKLHVWHLVGFAVALFVILALLIRLAERRSATATE